MTHWQQQFRRISGFAAALLLLLLMQSIVGLPFHQIYAPNLSPLKPYRNLDSLVGVALVRGRNVVNDLEALYKLRQLASGVSQTGRSSVPVSSSSSPPPSVQEAICENALSSHQAIPASRPYETR